MQTENATDPMILLVFILALVVVGLTLALIFLSGWGRSDQDINSSSEHSSPPEYFGDPPALTPIGSRSQNLDPYSPRHRPIRDNLLANGIFWLFSLVAVALFGYLGAAYANDATLKEVACDLVWICEAEPTLSPPTLPPARIKEKAIAVEPPLEPNEGSEDHGLDGHLIANQDTSDEAPTIAPPAPEVIGAEPFEALGSAIEAKPSENEAGADTSQDSPDTQDIGIRDDGLSLIYR
ncbi:MAG: hypothetical protein AAF127_09045 [Pseudomonadota bacterium]